MKGKNRCWLLPIFTDLQQLLNNCKHWDIPCSRFLLVLIQILWIYVYRGFKRQNQRAATSLFLMAGRLAMDEQLMQELIDIKTKTDPQNIFFVCDAMIGQSSVTTVKQFDKKLEFTGFILTKLDGDARGGAALSIKSITGKPIKFLGMGEKLDALEEFRPEGLADRILGYGDIVGLMKDFEAFADKRRPSKMQRKCWKEIFFI